MFIPIIYLKHYDLIKLLYKTNSIEYWVKVKLNIDVTSIIYNFNSFNLFKIF